MTITSSKQHSTQRIMAIIFAQNNIPFNKTWKLLPQNNIPFNKTWKLLPQNNIPLKEYGYYFYSKQHSTQ